MYKKIIPLLILSISSTLIMACSHVAGNVVPDNGPTMEIIYDNGGDSFTTGQTSVPALTEKIAISSVKPEVDVPARVDSPTFSALQNPQLTLYVFPHLAGTEWLPIPGYWTAFSAYPRTYYALPLAVDEHSAGKLQP
jgi:conjugative transfer region lipoprotein (TIGR03751 family)